MNKKNRKSKLPITLFISHKNAQDNCQKIHKYIKDFLRKCFFIHITSFYKSTTILNIINKKSIQIKKIFILQLLMEIL